MARNITLTIELADKAFVSKSEAVKAEQAGRPAVARSLASSGGFTLAKASDGTTVKVSYNVIQ